MEYLAYAFAWQWKNNLTMPVCFATWLGSNAPETLGSDVHGAWLGRKKSSLSCLLVNWVGLLFA